MLRSPSWKLLISAAAALTLASSPAAAEPTAKPTIVLVHGAFAESNSWNAVIPILTGHGYRVVAVANPLRSLKGDAAYVAAFTRSVPGDVLLVGHSYGGEVISEASSALTNVRGLVFVSGLATDVGESGATIGDTFKGSTLGATLAPPVPQPDGTKDVYIAQDKFWKQFAADLPEKEAELLAVGQRPITQEALAEPARGPGWKVLPSWFIYGSLDRNITATAHAFMAKRAKAREAIEVDGSSHVVMVSHPREVAALIERAAAAK
jgi:pimeloyl-ACP methyl ester carboxylesterase